MLPEHYILDGTAPIEEPDLLTWGRWFETAERHVADTTLQDGTRVSTVFLGLDHAFGQGPPLLFETMVFAPAGASGACWRWSTWHQAEQGHAAVVARLQALPAAPLDEVEGTVIWPPPPAP